MKTIIKAAAWWIVIIILVGWGLRSCMRPLTPQARAAIEASTMTRLQTPLVVVRDTYALHGTVVQCNASPVTGVWQVIWEADNGKLLERLATQQMAPGTNVVLVNLRYPEAAVGTQDIWLLVPDTRTNHP